MTSHKAHFRAAVALILLVSLTHCSENVSESTNPPSAKARGAIAWSVHMGGPVRSPVCGMGMVYVQDSDGLLHALDINSGEHRWSVDNKGFWTLPVFDAGRLITGGFGKSLYMFDAATGSKLDSCSIGAIIYCPAAGNGMYFVGCSDHQLRGIDASSMTERWRFSMYIHYTAPTYADGLVYAADLATHDLFALNSKTGAELWRFNVPKGCPAPVAVANGIVFTGDGEGVLHAIDAGSGTAIWQYSGTKHYRMVSTPAVSEGCVFVGGTDKIFQALDASTGRLLWKFTCNGRVESSPAVDRGTVYVGDDTGMLYALNTRTGAVEWTFTARAGIDGPILAENGMVFFGSQDSCVYALK